MFEENKVGKYLTRQIEAEAICFTGDNKAEVLKFCPMLLAPDFSRPILLLPVGDNLTRIEVGEWIVRNPRTGYFTKCSGEMFPETFEPARE